MMFDDFLNIHGGIFSKNVSVKLILWAEILCFCKGDDYKGQNCPKCQRNETFDLMYKIHSPRFTNDATITHGERLYNQYGTLLKYDDVLKLIQKTISKNKLKLEILDYRSTTHKSVSIECKSIRTLKKVFLLILKDIYYELEKEKLDNSAQELFKS